MAKYKSKPNVVDAVQFDGTQASIDKIVLLQGGSKDVNWIRVGNDELHIRTPVGTTRCQLGEWIIKGDQGEIFHYDPDTFAENYELIED